jgi:hypothetical protein
MRGRKSDEQPESSPVVIVLQHTHPADPAVVTAGRPHKPTPIASTRQWRGVVAAVAVLVGGPPAQAGRRDRDVLQRALGVPRTRVPFRRLVDRGSQEAAPPEPPPPTPRGGGDDVGVVASAPLPAHGVTEDGADRLRVVVVAGDYDEARAQERAHQVTTQYVRDEEYDERRVGDVPAAVRTPRRTMLGGDEFVAFVSAVAITGAPPTDDDRPPERREVRQRAREHHGHAEERSANNAGGRGGGGKRTTLSNRDVAKTYQNNNSDRSHSPRINRAAVVASLCLSVSSLSTTYSAFSHIAGRNRGIAERSLPRRPRPTRADADRRASRDNLHTQ